MSRRWRYPRISRGEFLWVPPPPTAAAPSVWSPRIIEQAGGRPRWLPRLRRGRFAEPPWPQVTPAAPTWVPGTIEQAGSRPRWAALTRRGRFWVNPSVSAAPGAPQGLARPVRRLPSVRRGDRFDPPWTPVVQAPSVWSPPTIQAARRLAGRPARRGRFMEPPWPQAVAPSAPVFVPRLLATHRPQPGTPRRARFPWVPPGQGQPTAFVCTRRRTGVRARRGQLWWTPSPTGAPPGPGPLVIPMVRRAGWRPRWPSHRPRRGLVLFSPPPPPPPFSVGVLTATDTGAATLTAAGTGGPTTATDSTGPGATSDQATGRLTATDKAGGPS